MPTAARSPTFSTPARTRGLLGPLLVGLATSAITLLSSSARADQCQVSADCGAGYACEVQQSGACPGIACLPGQPCPEPDCGVSETRSCVPVACSGASDCPSKMVCHTETTSSCNDAAPAAPCAGDSCDGGSSEPPPDCSVESRSYCTPRYLLPCQTASDCGAGFRCVEEVTQWCNGSGPSDPSDGGVANIVAPDQQCGETRTGTFVCQLIEVTCTADSDCASDFVCATVSGSSCASDLPSSSGGGQSGFAPPSDEAPERDAGIDTCKPTVAAKVCQPRDFDYGGYGVGYDGDSNAGGGTRGEGEESPQQADDLETDHGGEGCSLGAGQNASNGWLLMVASLCAATVYRRRTATRG